MADNKKYYYLKLKEDFFDSDEMLLLQGMKDGYLYSDILMKMYLRSLKNEGRLMYKDYIPYSLEMISTITRHQVGTVERAMKIFEQLKLVEVLDNGAIYMMDIQNFIGQSSTEAAEEVLSPHPGREETERFPGTGGIDSGDAGTGAGEATSRKAAEAEKGNGKEGRHDAAL